MMECRSLKTYRVYGIKYLPLNSQWSTVEADIDKVFENLRWCGMFSGCF